MMVPDERRAEVLDLADRIEAEMKKLGLWRDSEAPTLTASSAFGAETMTFEEWLQFTFLPGLRQAAQTASFPASSNVAVAAIRNLDGLKESERLIDLLSDVDKLAKQ